MTFPPWALAIGAVISVVLCGFAFVRLVDWGQSVFVDVLTVSAIAAGAVVGLLELRTTRRVGLGEASADALEGPFWLWYDRLSYRLLFPLLAVFSAVILRCATDYLITGHAVVHKVHEYDAHRVFYPVMMAGLTGFALWWVMQRTRLWERWAFWKPDRIGSGRALVVSAILVLVLLTEVFTAVTVVLVTQDAITARGGDLTDANIYWRTELLYLWQFVDSIPAIDATTTLNWKPPYHLEGISGGSLLLAFKVLVLLPIVGLIVDFIRHPRGNAQDPGIARLLDSLANRPSS
jgi:hypothetical protein